MLGRILEIRIVNHAQAAKHGVLEIGRKSGSKTNMAKFPYSHFWIFHGFPELDPDAIVRQQPGDKVLATEEERQRAWWLWQRRPREMNVLAYGILLGAGAIAHTPFLLLGSPQLFCLFHACYVLFVLWVIGVFLIKEARYRRWKNDYLRAVARLAR